MNLFNLFLDLRYLFLQLLVLLSIKRQFSSLLSIALNDLVSFLTLFSRYGIILKLGFLLLDKFGRKWRRDTVLASLRVIFLLWYLSERMNWWKFRIHWFVLLTYNKTRVLIFVWIDWIDGTFTPTSLVKDLLSGKRSLILCNSWNIWRWKVLL